MHLVLSYYVKLDMMSIYFYFLFNLFFKPAGGRPRCRSADPAHYLDHRTHHKCNVDLHKKCNRHLHCSDSGQPLSERAVWKPPGVAKTNQNVYYSRPTTPLSSQTSFTAGIPWRTAARASRCR